MDESEELKQLEQDIQAAVIKALTAQPHPVTYSDEVPDQFSHVKITHDGAAPIIPKEHISIVLTFEPGEGFTKEEIREAEQMGAKITRL